VELADQRAVLGYIWYVNVPRDVNETRNVLRATLNRCESWLGAAASAPDASDNWPRTLREDGDIVRRLRTRAASALINVALLGSFSSGKSFLLSGLQGGLELVEVTDESGELADKYVGLLPSSPVPTTSWPFSVVPVDSEAGVDASGTGFLRVRFADAPPDEWEDVGNSPAPAVVAAYAMGEADITNRLRAHRGREVAEVELLLADTLLPAKFYDLPGVGSSNTTHDSIVRWALRDADCYLYVTPAGRTLSETDLALVRVLYDHCMLPGQNNQRKRVVWAVTAIDTASHLDLRNQPEWKATVARNNQYLRDNFKLPDGRPDLEFIGEGFIAVYPAWEASGAKLAAEGAETAAHRQRNKSNMDELRRAIEDLISTGTGTRHIAAVAAETRYLISQRHQVLDQRLQTERLEIDELKERLELQRRRVELLDTALPTVREELERKLQQRVQRAARPFNRLAGHLHSALDAVIRATDLNKPTKANQIQVSKAQSLRAWLESPTGPVTLWNQEYEAFKQDVVHTIDRVFGDRELAGQLPGFAFDVNDVSVPQQARRPTTGPDIVQRAAALVGIVTPVAASGSWLYGLAAAGTLLPPAGMVAGAAGLVYLGLQIRKGRASSIDVLREEWIQAIDTEAAAVRDQFTLATGVQATDVIDHLTDNLAQYREQLEESSEFIRERIAQPENRARQEVIEQLEPLCTEGAGLLAALRSLETPDARA
jgi:hypothetical protein